MKAAALILAAGDSKRLGYSKSFVKLGTETALARVVRIFLSHPSVNRLVIVCRRADLQTCTKTLAHLSRRKTIMLVIGGATRQDSCMSGLRALAALPTTPSTPVLIHNVANPLVTAADITAMLNAIKRYDAVAVATPLAATVKEMKRNALVRRTLPRDTLMITQTPQCMTLKTALRAHDRARRDRFLGTDDVELVERLGGTVKLVPASEHNFKITTRIDLLLVQLLTKKQ